MIQIIKTVLPPQCPPEGNPNNQNCPPPPCPPEGNPNNQNCPPPPCPPEGNPNNQNCPPPPCPPEGDPNNPNCPPPPCPPEGDPNNPNCPPPPCPPEGDPNNPNCPPPPCPPEGDPNNQNCPPPAPPPPPPPAPSCPPEGDPNNPNCPPPTQQSDLLVYENPELGFKIQYPANWTKAGNDKGGIPVMFTLAESQDGITTSPLQSLATDKKIKANILVSVQPVGTSSLQQTGIGETQQIKASLEQFSLQKINELIHSKNTKFNILEYDPTATLGVKNVPAYKLVYNGTNTADNSKVKGSDIFTIQDNKAYSILYLGEEKEYDKHLPNIQMMTNSFEILES